MKQWNTIQCTHSAGKPLVLKRLFLPALVAAQLVPLALCEEDTLADLALSEAQPPIVQPVQSSAGFGRGRHPAHYGNFKSENENMNKRRVALGWARALLFRKNIDWTHKR